MTRLSKQELKAPDKIWQQSRKTFDWMLENAVVIGILLILTLAVVIGGSYYQLQKQKWEAEAQYHLGQAQSAFEVIKLESKPEDKAKSEETLLQSLQTLETEFAESRAQGLSQLIRAERAVEKKDFAAAIAATEAYVKVLSGQDKVLAQYSLGKLFEDGQQWEKALDQYDQILKVKEKTNVVRPLAHLAKGGVLRAMKKYDESLKALQGFISEFSDSPLLQQARASMALTKQVMNSSAAQKASP